MHQNDEETTPYRFENIIKDLLVAMGYDDVTVTTRLSLLTVSPYLW